MNLQRYAYPQYRGDHCNQHVCLTRVSPRPVGQAVWKWYGLVDDHDSGKSPYKTAEKHLRGHGHDCSPCRGESVASGLRRTKLL